MMQSLFAKDGNCEGSGASEDVLCALAANDSETTFRSDFEMTDDMRERRLLRCPSGVLMFPVA
jgi:hypothetical protein